MSTARNIADLINTSGNVGIGTDNPDVKLHVQGSSGAVNPSGYSVFDVVIEENSEAALGILGNSYSSIYFGDSANPIEAGIVYNHSTDELELRGSGNNTRIIIEDSGNTVIRPGTTYSTSSSTATSSNIPLYVESVSGVNSGTPPTTGSTPDANMALRLQSGGNFNAALDFGVGGGAGAYIQYHDREDYTTYYNLHLQPNGGKVGIGTDNLESKFVVQPTANNTDGVRIWRTGVDGDQTNLFVNIGGSYNAQIFKMNWKRVNSNSADLRFNVDPTNNTDENSFIVRADNTISLPKRSADTTGANGDMYYNTALGAPRIKTSDGWVSFGVAPGTQANPLTSVAQAQAQNMSSGLHWFQNSSGQLQELYYDSGDGGWIMVSSNNASSTTIPSGTSRNNLAYTIRRNGTMGALGTASPDNDYLIGGWIDNFSWTRARLVGFGRGSTNGTYSWSNLGTYINCQFNATGWANVVTLANVAVSGTSSVYTQNTGYWTVDGIQADYNNGGFAANTNQTTIGMVGVAASDGDPDSGCYMGHGSSEGHFEGWYDSGGGSADCQGYTTWVR